jgi:hypothetical protein
MSLFSVLPSTRPAHHTLLHSVILTKPGKVVIIKFIIVFICQYSNLYGFQEFPTIYGVFQKELYNGIPNVAV